MQVHQNQIYSSSISNWLNSLLSASFWNPNKRSQNSHQTSTAFYGRKFLCFDLLEILVLCCLCFYFLLSTVTIIIFLWLNNFILNYFKGSYLAIYSLISWGSCYGHHKLNPKWFMPYIWLLLYGPTLISLISFPDQP